MVRRLLIVTILALTLPAHAATRWFSERAESPVKWQEWGRAALERAQKEKRPVFLSIGYAASWDGFRMQRDAFLAPNVVAILNADYVPILLDPIEHPELAEAYAHVLRTMNGAKGTPLNLVLTPALEPFAGGGFLSGEELNRLLVGAINRWNNDQANVIAEARANVAKARATAEQRSPLAVDAATLEAVVDGIAKTYERDNTVDPGAIPFLLRYAARTKHEPLRALAVTALRNRAASRVRDQLGGGFHRCDTCFEKLLYDQALMALAYLDAYEVSKDPDLAQVVMTTLDYAMRDLRLPRSPGFEASQDAYSLVPKDGRAVSENGTFYLWTRDEVARIVGNDAAAKVLSLYPLSEGVANLPLLSEARFFGETYNELAAPLQKMLDVRQKRPAPFRDPTIVTGWNGLMVSALSRAAIVLREPDYLEAARYAATGLTTQAWNAKKQTLVRTGSGTPALAEDYAMAIAGLLDLFESSQDVKWLDFAVTLQQRQDQLFWDASLGRYSTGTTLPETMRGMLLESDDELPSVNAVAAMNLLRLATLTGNEAWSARPAMIFHSFGGHLRNDGARLPHLAAAYELSLIAPKIVVVTGNIGKEATRTLLRSIQERPEPMRAVVFLPHAGPARQRVVKSLPFTGALAPDPDVPVAYTCANGECRRQ
ncbi:MAG TPA: DUF255 domain-containing protein [Thermoanaerobaculia bacterium]|nr:DUF255 domain-containing protein [Thermoanaerobaculia bacterium]